MSELPNPFINPDSRFVLNETAFLEDIQLLPACIESPRPEYLEALDTRPIVEILASYMR